MKSSNEKNTSVLSARGTRLIIGLLCLCLMCGLLIYSFSSAINRNTVENTDGSASVPDVSVSQNIPVTDSLNEGDGSADGAAAGSEEDTEDKADSILMPAEGEIVKDYSEQGLVYSETLNQYLVHKAVDISTSAGAMVIAVEDGTVTSVEEDDRYGLTVVIAHGDGLETSYSCLGEAQVSIGDVVSGGDVIGTVGEEGCLFESAEGPHLHFETLKDGLATDPHKIWTW